MFGLCVWSIEATSLMFFLIFFYCYVLFKLFWNCLQLPYVYAILLMLPYVFIILEIAINKKLNLKVSLPLETDE